MLMGHACMHHEHGNERHSVLCPPMLRFQNYLHSVKRADQDAMAARRAEKEAEEKARLAGPEGKPGKGPKDEETKAQLAAVRACARGSLHACLSACMPAVWCKGRAGCQIPADSSRARRPACMHCKRSGDTAMRSRFVLGIQPACRRFVHLMHPCMHAHAVRQ